MSQLSKTLYQGFLDHLSLELNAFWTYWAYKEHFRRVDIKYSGFAKYFAAESEEERGHAQAIIDFLIRRGHSVNFPGLNALPAFYSKSPLDLMKVSLELENEVLVSFNRLAALIDDEKDVDANNFIEEMVTEQQESINGLEGKITELERLCNDSSPMLGLWQYDKSL